MMVQVLMCYSFVLLGKVHVRTMLRESYPHSVVVVVVVVFKLSKMY